MAEPEITQAAYWNGEAGERWARHQQSLDAVFAPLTEALFAGADIQPRATILDIGCGAGDTAIAAARRAGPGGRVVAADVSAPLLAAARGRAASEAADAAPITWIEADAQVHDFGNAGFAQAISRFGVMFFEDSVAAFANIRRALVPGGRFTVLCWRPLDANAWIAVPRAIVLPLVPEPEPMAPGGPGPFRFADPEAFREILAAVGFREIGIEPVDRALTLGRSDKGSAREAAAAAAELVLELGPVSRLVREQSDAVRAAARAAVAEDFAARAEGGSVSLGAACWLVSAWV
ncbi:MAG TPA: class I SAM-dependent methyltransferase [Methylobacterium sp.]